jgi:hypothetical protein
VVDSSLAILIHTFWGIKGIEGCGPEGSWLQKEKKSLWVRALPFPGC